MGRLGTYIVATTFFATIMGQSPVGLPYDTHGKIAPRVGRIVQDTAWRVVQKEPRTGVQP